MRMKYSLTKYIVLFVALFLSLKDAHAQQSAERAYEGVFPPVRDDAPKRRDRYFVDVFQPRFLETPVDIKQEWYSWGLNFSRMFDVPFNNISTLGFAWGVNFSTEHLYMNGTLATRINLLGEKQHFIKSFDSAYNYKLHKQVFNYIELPIQLRFRTNKNTNFFFYPGFKAGFMLDHHNKTIDNDVKFKFYSFKGLNRLRYGATLHLGIDRLGLYVYYPLSNLFVKGKGEDISIFCVGISINAF